MQVVVGLKTRVDWKLSETHDAVGINDFAAQCGLRDGPGEKNPTKEIAPE